MEAVLAALGLFIYSLLSAAKGKAEEPRPMFKSFKGMNFAWGMNAAGTSVYSNWLSSQYNEALVAESFDWIRSMGCKTVGIWIWLPRMLQNLADIANPGFVPVWNAAWKAQFDSFLANVVVPRDMEVICTLWNPGDGAGYSAPNSDFLRVGGIPPQQYLNWIVAANDWVSGYVKGTALGEGVAAWVGLKELAVQTYNEFMTDLYASLKAIPGCQPIGVDVWALIANLYTWTPVNINIYTNVCDFWCFHQYNNQGWIPNLDRLGKPWILGEFGSDPANDALRSPGVVATFLRNAARSGAQCALAWSWTAGNMIATHTGGAHRIAPTGQVVAGFDERMVRGAREGVL